MSIDVIFDRKYFTGGYKFIIGRFQVDIRSNSTTPRRVALARMFKEAGLRSPRTQLTKVQIEISVLGRRTEAYDRHVNYSRINFSNKTVM